MYPATGVYLSGWRIGTENIFSLLHHVAYVRKGGERRQGSNQLLLPAAMARQQDRDIEGKF